MAKKKVEFVVTTKDKVNTLYLLGNTNELGAWNLNKASAMKFDSEKNAFVCSKMLEENETIEFKFISQKDWKTVEKGIFKEEITNHIAIVKKGLVIEIVINNFAE